MSTISQLIVEQGRQAAEARAATGELWGRTIENLSQIPGNIYAQRMRQQAADRQAAYEQQRLQAETDRAAAEQQRATAEEQRRQQDAAHQIDTENHALVTSAAAKLRDASGDNVDPDEVRNLFTNAAARNLITTDERDQVLNYVKDPATAKHVLETTAGLPPPPADFTLRPGETRYSFRAGSSAPNASGAPAAPAPAAGASATPDYYGPTEGATAPPTTPAPVIPPGAARPVASVPAAAPRVTYGQPQTQLVDGKQQLVRAGSDGKIYDLNQQPIDPARVKPKPMPADLNASEPQLPAWAMDASRGGGADGNKVDPVTGLTPNGLYQDAITYMTTFHFPPQGIGNQPRPKAVRTAIQNKVGAIAADAGMDVPTFAALYKANAGSLAQTQKYADAAQSFLETADKNTQLLEGTLKKIPDTGSPLFNLPLREFEQRAAGDPNLAQFAIYLRSVQNEYARIITNPNLTGQLTDTAREETAGLVRPDATVNQILASVSALSGEGSNRLASVGEQLRRITRRVENPSGSPAAAGAPLAAAAPPAPNGRVRVQGPNGETGTVPVGTALGDGWKVVGP